MVTERKHVGGREGQASKSGNNGGGRSMLSGGEEQIKQATTAKSLEQATKPLRFPRLANLKIVCARSGTLAFDTKDLLRCQIES